MSISGQNLTIVIVTFKSENVIHQCIESIDKDIPIIVVENSNNQKFKDDLESKYKNLKCILSNDNIGMGAGNNIGIKSAKTEYVYILNPDVTLKPNTLEKIYSASSQITDFSILTPINFDSDFPNWKKKNLKKINNQTQPAQVDSVDGFSMLLNKNKFENESYFDENIFLFLENDDLCLRVKKEGGLIFVLPSSEINHKGSKSVNLKYKNELELSRNWHWVWSKFYFNRKHFGYLKAAVECFPTYCSAMVKFMFYYFLTKLFWNNEKILLRKKIYFNRAQGFYFAFKGKSSCYRPNLAD